MDNLLAIVDYCVIQYFLILSLFEQIITNCKGNTNANTGFNYVNNHFTYDKILGNFLVGTEVINCPQTSVPIPKKIHHSHWSRERALVEKAIFPYWIMTTCERLYTQFTTAVRDISH